MTFYNINPGGKNLMNTTAILVGARRTRAFDTKRMGFNRALRLQSTRTGQDGRSFAGRDAGSGRGGAATYREACLDDGDN